MSCLLIRLGRRLIIFGSICSPDCGSIFRPAPSRKRKSGTVWETALDMLDKTLRSFMSGNRGGLGFVIIMIVWMMCVIVYATTWNPSHITLCAVHPDERVFILRLPAEGPLQQLLEKGSVVTLAAPEPPVINMTPPPSASANTVGATPVVKAAGPSDPLPPRIKHVEDATVVGRICGVEQSPAWQNDGLLCMHRDKKGRR
jgi:hypothetical protein